jgi:diaminopimelate epimerase
LQRGLIARSPIRVQTMNRLLELHSHQNGLVTVDMGAPDFSPASLPFDAPAQQATYTLSVPQYPGADTVTDVNFYAVSMGNPHIVMTVSDCGTAPVATLGPVLCSWASFAQGVNVGFMQIIDRSTIRLRVFERGAGETEACGTGTCAAVVCGIRAGLLDNHVRALLTGGELQIEWQGDNSPVLMTGPATTVYEGNLLL